MPTQGAIRDNTRSCNTWVEKRCAGMAEREDDDRPANPLVQVADEASGCSCSALRVSSTPCT
jgi:hypothetical protein